MGFFETRTGQRTGGRRSSCMSLHACTRSKAMVHDVSQAGSDLVPKFGHAAPTATQGLIMICCSMPFVAEATRKVHSCDEAEPSEPHVFQHGQQCMAAHLVMRNGTARPPPLGVPDHSAGRVPRSYPGRQIGAQAVVTEEFFQAA